MQIQYFDRRDAHLKAKDRRVCRFEFVGGVLLIGTDRAGVFGYAA